MVHRCARMAYGRCGGVGRGRGVGVTRWIGVGVGVASVAAQYLAPVFKSPWVPVPPQMIISMPIQIAECSDRASGTSVVLVALQLSVAGLYLPPVFRNPPTKGLNPAQTTISAPVHTAVCAVRSEGALVKVVAVQLSEPGLYLPPVFR